MRRWMVYLTVVVSAAAAWGAGTSSGPGTAAARLGALATQPESAWPAWRKAMTEPNTIYDISDNTVASLRFTFPSSPPAFQFTTTDDGNQGTGIGLTGYGGGVLYRGIGRHGVLVFGNGGENYAGNAIGALNLNGDKAHYEVWQQPIYSTKPGPGVEFYWSPADAAALAVNRRFSTYFPKDAPDTWDRRFPVAIGGWVYPAPVKYLEAQEGVPLGQYRYDQHCYIPAEYTGLGTGVWFIPSAFFMAPGFYYGINKALETDFWPSGAKRMYSHYQREDTKAWTRVSTPIPENMRTGSFANEVVGFSAKHRQVVAPLIGTKGETGVFDLSNGVANGTWSMKKGPVKGSEVNIRCATKCAMSNGHPRGCAFLVWHTGPYGKAPDGLGILDLDDPAYPIYGVRLPALTGSGETIGLHYVPALDKFISFGVSDKVYCQRITIPDDLGDTAAYRVEDVPLATAPGVDLKSSCTEGGQVQFVERLNCFVFLANRTPAKAFWIR